MSLAQRLAAVVPQRSNRTCGTCVWINSLSGEDRAAWDDWLAGEKSIAQLWEISSALEDSPYGLSLAAMRMCIRTHNRGVQ